jgi:hypothetical protein
LQGYSQNGGCGLRICFIMPDTSRTEKISLEGCKVYGPYLRPDGRKHVIIYNAATNKRKTVSYPKYLLQYEQGLEYNKGDTTDHIDENFKNDNLTNLQVLERGENVRKSMQQEHRKAKRKDFICPQCNKLFQQFARQVQGNQIKQQKAAPFCSRHCAGQYGTDVQRQKKFARLSQLVEETDLSSVKSRFESEGGHQLQFEIDDYI